MSRCLLPVRNSTMLSYPAPIANLQSRLFVFLQSADSWAIGANFVRRTARINASREVGAACPRRTSTGLDLPFCWYGSEPRLFDNTAGLLQLRPTRCHNLRASATRPPVASPLKEFKSRHSSPLSALCAWIAPCQQLITQGQQYARSRFGAGRTAFVQVWGQHSRLRVDFLLAPSIGALRSS